MEEAVRNGVVIFETIEAITSRERYVETVNIKNSNDARFGGIVGPYHVQGERIRCGISSCRTPNLHGVVIYLKDGTETNVGKDCGGKHFDAEFKAEVRRHDAIYNRHLKLTRIKEIKKTPEKLDRLILLKRQYDALKTKRLDLRGKIDRGQDARLSRMGKERDGRVFKHELLAGDDLEAYYETNPSERKSGARPSRQILIGEIEGVSFFSASFKDEEVLSLVGFMRGIYDTDDSQIALWKEREINYAHRVVNAIDRQMDRVEELIHQGQLFFSLENLKRLSLVGIQA